MFLSPGQRGTLDNVELVADKGVKSRALPVHTLLSTLLVLLFRNPHLLEGSLENRKHAVKH